MDEQRSQLGKVLRLALASPFPGEREKAVSLLLLRLQQAGLELHDLDPNFPAGAGENDLRERAELCFHFEVTLSSAEEALFFLVLLQRLGPTGSTGDHLSGHQLRCFTDKATRERVTRLLAERRPELSTRLAAAQQQAQREYRARREELFRQAVLTLTEQLAP